MVRRLQLMEPERRGVGTRLADAAAGLRDGLLRDNKVLPPVLAALALIIFAWLLAGVIIGDQDQEKRVARQAAQPSVAQSPDNGVAPDAPAPGVENRDNESLDVYESKDPFRELFPAADANGDAGGDTSGDADGGSDATGGDTGGDDSGGDAAGDDTGSGTDGSESGANGGSGSNGSGTGSGDGSGDSGSGQYGGDGRGDFLDQTSPGDPGFDDGSGNGSGSGGGNGSGDGSGSGGSGSGNGSGGGSGSGSGQYGGDGDGNGDLFDSGGELGR